MSSKQYDLGCDYFATVSEDNGELDYLAVYKWDKDACVDNHVRTFTAKDIRKMAIAAREEDFERLATRRKLRMVPPSADEIEAQNKEAAKAPESHSTLRKFIKFTKHFGKHKGGR